MSPGHSPRKLIVDDNDPTIHYSGPWFSIDGQEYNAEGGLGKPYCNSLHGTTGKASFSYSFNGSTGQIFGNADISNSSGVINPSWECILDGVSIPVKKPPSSPTNTYCFCEWNSTMGSHTVALKVKGHGKDIWFDQLRYVPDPQLVVKNATVLVTHKDAALMFDSGWQPAELDSRMRVAVSEGSVVTFPFFGSGLSWYGNVPGGKHQIPATGFYSIDGKPPINFTVFGQPERPGSQKNKPNQLFFKTPHLRQRTHMLTVTSLGTAQPGPMPGSMPLGLSFLVLNNAELPVLDAIPTATISATPGGQHRLQSGDQNSQQGLSSKAIIGGVVGGVILCFLILFTLLFLRRRRRTSLISVESAISPPPYAPPQSMTQISGTQASQRSTSESQEYPFALPHASTSNTFHNFAKRFTSISTRPNSLFQIARLSVLPVKRQPSQASSASSRTYRPYVSRLNRSNTGSSTGSTATLLPSAPPSRKTSIVSFPDDETVVVEHKDGEVRVPHARPPDGMEYLPRYTG